MRRIQQVLLPVVLLVGLAASACGGGGEDGEAAPGGTDGAVEGLSREEIRARAEAMSPEEAEQLGIVDSSIHVERLTSPEDSAMLPDTLRLSPPDSGR